MEVSDSILTRIPLELRLQLRHLMSRLSVPHTEVHEKAAKRIQELLSDIRDWTRLAEYDANRQ